MALVNVDHAWEVVLNRDRQCMVGSSTLSDLSKGRSGARLCYPP
jgi:hypothetical protein